MKIRKAGAVLGLVLVCAAGAGRASGSDIRFWEQLGLNWSPFAPLKIFLEKELRYENSFTDMDSDITELGLRWELAKWLDIRFDYRFISKGKDEKRDRIDGNITIGWSRPGVALSNRFRLQKEFITETGAEAATETVFRDRVRATLRPEKTLRPYGDAEIFLGLGENGSALNMLRLGTGLEIAASKKATVTAFYVYQNKFGNTAKEISHIFGARFSYGF